MTIQQLFGVSLASALLLTACGDEAAAPPPAAGTATVAAKPRAASGSADGGVAGEGAQYIYSYMPMGKRDPFRSPIGDKPKNEDNTQTPEAGCSEPLCAYELEQLALVAVVSGDANPVAMLEDPTHTGHIIRRNTKVGKQGGKVTQILRDCVVVTEYYLTPDGKKNPNRVNLCVKKETNGPGAFDLFNNKSFE